MLLAVEDHHGVAVDVLLVLLDAELGHQGLDAVLPRPDPGPTAVDPRSVIQYLGEGPATNPVTRLEQGNGAARLFEPQGRGEACEARAHHATVDICHGSTSRFRRGLIRSNYAVVSRRVGTVDRLVW